MSSQLSGCAQAVERMGLSVTTVLLTLMIDVAVVMSGGEIGGLVGERWESRRYAPPTGRPVRGMDLGVGRDRGLEAGGEKSGRASNEGFGEDRGKSGRRYNSGFGL